MDTDSDSKLTAGTTFVRRAAIVGAGRLGTALAAALSGAGVRVEGPFGRGATLPAGVDAVLLCAPTPRSRTRPRPSRLGRGCSSATAPPRRRSPRSPDTARRSACTR